MRILSTFGELRSLGAPVFWAIGFFDGVHTGHAQVVQAAHAPGALRGVLTFSGHPLQLLCPQRAPRLITPVPDYKARLLQEQGAEVLLRLPFTRELADMSPTDFLDALQAHSRVAGVSVGANWNFGKARAGNAAFLSEQGKQRGFEVRVQPLLQLGGGTVCSGAVRVALAEGRLDDAAAMLGRPFAVCGTVEHGQHLARQLGFPTANITLPPHSAVPPAGAYAVACRHAGRLLFGVADLGFRPSIREAEKLLRLETHFFDFSGDLYGQPLTVALLHFLRPEQKFSSLSALQAQIQRDSAAARAFFQSKNEEKFNFLPKF
ncbi:MAG: riboflavin biosynthesis protein RibF [Akkermansia sp.]